jgi:hypothetical protein
MLCGVAYRRVSRFMGDARRRSRKQHQEEEKKDDRAKEIKVVNQKLMESFKEKSRRNAIFTINWMIFFREKKVKKWNPPSMSWDDLNSCVFVG